jgi:hypothetical protein
MKHFTLIIGLTIFLSSCGLKSKMETQDKAQKEANFIIENFNNYDSLKNKLPEKYFNPEQTKEFITNFNKSCDWQNRKGKFVDYFTMKNIGGTDQTAFIYEYFLNCDSIRIILTYNMTKNSPELFKIKIEPIEEKNQMIIDPSKQLIPQ